MSATPDSEDTSSHPVELWIYDISGGTAAMMSQMLIGKHIEGIWHTSIFAYGHQFFYGGGGIVQCLTEEVPLGPPLKREKLGETFIPLSVFLDYLTELGQSTFSGSSYNLLGHNCNNFTEEVAQFLCGTSIPSHILKLPEEFLSTSLGQQFGPVLASLSAGPNIYPVDRLIGRRPSPDLQNLNQQIEEARIRSLQLEEKRNKLNEKLARRERRKEKKRRKLQKERGISCEEFDDCVTTCRVKMAESVAEVAIAAENGNGDEAAAAGGPLPSDIALQLEAEERQEAEERKKHRDPPIVYKDAVQIHTEFDALVGLIDGKLNEEEQRSLEELHQYMLEDEGSWALGENFLNFIGRLLHDKSLPVEVRVRTLNVLALAALKDDVILLLHQDRREHIIMNYAHDIDRFAPEEQESLALFVCNLFENISSSEWLLYISEWTFSNAQISNIRVTTKVAVHSLLSERPILQERGVAIMHNLACKEVKTVVFDDVVVELTMAVLQFFQSKPAENHLFACMKALARFTQISGQEVPQLIQMIGPDPNTFRGVSPRIDEQIALVVKKIR